MSPLPPGPKSLPLLDFLRAGLGSPVPVFRRLAAEHGDTFRFSAQSGPMTVTGDPEAIRAIYTADPDTFSAWGAEIAEPVFGRTSLVVASGARHRRDRKLLTPPFNAGTMRDYGATIAEIAAAAAARWTPGRPFSMLETTQAIALDVIVRVVFGVRESRVRATREAILGLIDSLTPLLFMFPWLRRDFGGLGPWAKNRRALAALDALLIEEIRARRSGDDVGQDILGLMLSARYDDGSVMDEREVAEQLRGLLFAGHETTAVVLAWALHWTHGDPEVLARVLAELDALGPAPEPDAFASLPYLEAVCHETLRLNPPVVDVGRVPRAPFQLKRFTIPAGEGLVPSPLLLHRREDLYPEPESFRPSRFLGRKFSPFEYIPFGGGSRRCLGAAFAMYEMKVILGTVLRGYRLRLASASPIAYVRRGITMGPRGGVPMICDGERERASSRIQASAA